MISTAQFWALAPLLIPALGIVLLMIQISFRRDADLSYGLTLAILLLTAAATPGLAASGPLQITPLLKMDDYALFFTLVFTLSAAATAVVSRDYLLTRAGQNEEYFLLLLLSTMGAITLAYATHFASMLLGLELMGVALYALIAYPDEGELPLEAATKYLVLSGAASAILLFGFALIYAALGSMSFADLASRMELEQTPAVIVTAGAVMIFTGLGFKLSAVPFHMWTPDVFEGAPAPISGFLATVSKGAVFAVLLRWYVDAELYRHGALLAALSVLAGASILVGNLLALRQDNVKRMLAYSSVAHMGYLLIVLVACGLGASINLAVEAAAYYLVAYIATSLAAFTLLGLLSKDSGIMEKDQLTDMNGLFWRQPGLAILFSTALLSLAGIPLTAGFIGKFYIFTTGIDASLWGLLWLLVIGSGMGIYYYLRVIFAMTTSPTGDTADDAGGNPVSTGSRWVLYLLIFSMLYLGIVPDPLMGFLRAIL